MTTIMYEMRCCCCFCFCSATPKLFGDRALMMISRDDKGDNGKRRGSLSGWEIFMRHLKFKDFSVSCNRTTDRATQMNDSLTYSPSNTSSSRCRCHRHSHLVSSQSSCHIVVDSCLSFFPAGVARRKGKKLRSIP